jgi:hypothetical protein
LPSRVVVNHLKFAEALPASLVETADEACRDLIEAGALSAALIQVDDVDAILVLTFPDQTTEERIKSAIGGPWMREHVLHLLAEPTQRSSGAVVAGSI